MSMVYALSIDRFRWIDWLSCVFSSLKSQEFYREKQSIRESGTLKQNHIQQNRPVHDVHFELVAFDRGTLKTDTCYVCRIHLIGLVSCGHALSSAISHL